MPKRKDVTSEQPITIPNENTDLRTFFETRARIAETLNDVLRKKAEQLIALIPADLHQWADAEGWSDPDRVAKRLDENHDKLSTSEGYSREIIVGKEGRGGNPNGLHNRDEATKKFELLKQAWAGIIDITISSEYGKPFSLNMRFTEATKSRLAEEK